MEIQKIFNQLKLIPNNFPVCYEDLKEIFSQDEKSKDTNGTTKKRKKEI